VTLALAIRPFQVNPPTQFLNIPGGVSPIRELSWDGQALSINGQRRLFPIERPDQVFAADFDAGNVPELLAKRQPPVASAITDATGLASAVLLYRIELPPRGSRTVGLVAPLAGGPALPADDASGWLNRQQTETANYWRKTLNVVSLRLPAAGRPLVNTLRTALAHILISRAGPALRPGSRSYALLIRDGAMMLTRCCVWAVRTSYRECVERFAPHQFANGKNVLVGSFPPDPWRRTTAREN
jgi:hypothetical protein